MEPIDGYRPLRNRPRVPRRSARLPPHQCIQTRRRLHRMARRLVCKSQSERRLGRAEVAEAVRRSRLDADAALHLGTGNVDRDVAVRHAVRRRHAGADPHGLRLERTTRALLARYPRAQSELVSGLLRTGRRFRPRRTEDEGGAFRRRQDVHRQRHQNLDDGRAHGRLDLLSHAHAKTPANARKASRSCCSR